MTKITYYDFTNLRYTAFFLNGFAENADERGFRFEVSGREPPEFADLALTREYLPRDHAFHAIFRYEGNDSFLFCIDAGDLNGNVALGGGYHFALLEKCRYYFKVNYNTHTILNNPALRPYAEKIKPIPLVFPIATTQPWRYMPRCLPGQGAIWPMEAIVKRSKSLLSSASLDTYRQLRNNPKDIDVFFVIRIYSDPSGKHDEILNENNARRSAIVEGLNKHGRFNMFVRYAVTENEDIGPLGTRYIRFREYLKLMSRARVGVYVRGYADCLSFKFGQLMALGMPIVGETILNNTENMYVLDRFGEQFAYDDPEFLVERVLYLLDNPGEAESLRRANVATFENLLTPGPVVAAILDQIGMA
jgi:hypothetical protein